MHFAIAFIAKERIYVIPRRQFWDTANKFLPFSDFRRRTVVLRPGCLSALTRRVALLRQRLQTSTKMTWMRMMWCCWTSGIRWMSGWSSLCAIVHIFYIPLEITAQLCSVRCTCGSAKVPMTRRSRKQWLQHRNIWSPIRQGVTWRHLSWWSSKGLSRPPLQAGSMPGTHKSGV